MKSTNAIYMGVAGLFIIFIIWGIFMKKSPEVVTTRDTSSGTMTATVPTTDNTPVGFEATEAKKVTASSNGAVVPTTSNNAQAADTDTQTGLPKEITQLMMRDDVVGTGVEAKAGDSITVQYVGALTNGTVFDASKNHGDTGFTFTLGAGQVIKGWDQGVQGMKVGGTRTLVIPANLAYGNQAVGESIPANSPLVFQVQLVKVEKK